MKRLFKQFSFPGGIPSHVAPETPGSIHEGGELGYALSHAYGAAFDNPDLIVACVVGDGEAETGPLATSWHSNKFLNPATDGAVLPILHLNGYKIANPCVLARISHEELDQLFRGYGYTPVFRRGRRSREHARADGGDAGDRHRRHPAHQDGGARDGDNRAPALADDRPAHAQGLDLPEGDRRQAHRGLLALAPGADGRDARQPRACAHPRRMDEELPAGGAVRRQRPAASASWPSCAPRRAPHERQPARQWRLAAARSAAAGFPRLRGRRAGTRRGDGRIDPGDGPLPARRDEAEHGVAQLPRCSAPTKTTRTAGRTCSKSPIAPGWRRPIPTTTISRPTGGSWRCSASTSARAGSKAIC